MRKLVLCFLVLCCLVFGFLLGRASSYRTTGARIVSSGAWPEFARTDEFSELDSVLCFTDCWKVWGYIENVGNRSAKVVWASVTIYDWEGNMVEMQKTKCWARTKAFSQEIKPGQTGGFTLYGTYSGTSTWSWDIDWEE